MAEARVTATLGYVEHQAQAALSSSALLGYVEHCSQAAALPSALLGYVELERVKWGMVTSVLGYVEVWTPYYVGSAFKIAPFTEAGVPAEPPLYARPTIEYAPFLQYQPSSTLNGLGSPAGFAGKPFCVCGRSVINSLGMAYYMALFPDSVSADCVVKCELYNPRTAAWEVYQGFMSRPTFTEVRPGLFVNFSFWLTDLVSSGWL